MTRIELADDELEWLQDAAMAFGLPPTDSPRRAAAESACSKLGLDTTPPRRMSIDEFLALTAAESALQGEIDRGKRAR